mmetsp:Transcript_19815/g.57500  ORF Transcript_19815/g.57500 Transcript_19815/m.57500 type:complete len:296 (-) Transcript_19815:199-1086(-)
MGRIDVGTEGVEKVGEVYDVVFGGEGGKVRLVPFIGGDVYRGVGGEGSLGQCSGGHFIPLLLLLVPAQFPRRLQYTLRGSHRIRILPAKVPSPHMQPVVFTLGIPARIAIPRPPPNGLDDASRRAEYLVSVSQMIPHQSLGPQIVPPILEERERVPLDQHPLLPSIGKMDQFRILQVRFVIAQFGTSRHGLPQTFDRRIIDGRGFALIIERIGETPAVLTEEYSAHDIAEGGYSDAPLRGEGGEALIRIPTGVCADLAEIFPQRQFVGVTQRGSRVVPVGPSVRGRFLEIAPLPA